MAVTSLSEWSTTAGSNTELNGISLAENVMRPPAVNNAFREMMAQLAAYSRRGADLATASTLNLDSVDADFLDLTGTTTVTAVTLTDTHSRRARAVGAFQLTASASLVVNGSTSTNYTTTAGDLLFFEGYGSSVVRVWTVSGGAGTTFATNAQAVTGTSTVLAVNPAGLAFATSGYATTATAAGTTTLTASSEPQQYFTGTTTQTVALPVTSTLNLGRPFRIVNNSTGAVTVNSSGGNLVVTVAAGQSAVVTCILTSGTTAASWHAVTFAGSSAGLEYVTSLTASNSASINFDSSTGVTFAAGYDYVIEVINLQPAADAYLMLRYGTGGTPTYQTTNYTSQFGGFAGTNSITGIRDVITTAIPVSIANGTSGGASAGEQIEATVTVRQPAANATHNALIAVKDTDSSALIRVGQSSGLRTTSEVLTGLQLLMSSGNITSGTLVLYRRRIS